MQESRKKRRYGPVDAEEKLAESNKANIMKMVTKVNPNNFSERIKQEADESIDKCVDRSML